MAEVSEKVQAIFQGLCGDRSETLKGDRFPAEVADRILAALVATAGEKLDSARQDPVKLDDVGFHLVDWNSDAAFIVALMLYPEEFTDEEIREGIAMFLVHVPAHVAEAARAGGYSTQNIFAEEA